MELRDIEYFAVIAEHGHLGRAANTLRLSQPALSKSLRRLEHALQCKLVRRTPRGVELTAEGSALFLRVRELRLSLQSIGREIAEVARGRVGHLRIGVGFPGPDQLFATAFAELLKDAPQLRIAATVSDNDVMIPALRNGELDLIVNFLTSIHSLEELVCEHLYDDQYVVIASKKHRLARRNELRLADLIDERWSVSPLTLFSQYRLQEAFRDAELRSPEIAFESRSLRLRLQTVSRSDLLDWTSRRFVEQSGLAPQLKILPIRELAWVRPVGLIYRRETYQSPALNRLIEMLKIAAKDLLPTD